MRLEFFPSVFEAGVQRGAGRLTQAAGRSGCHGKGQALHPLKVALGGKAGGEAVEDHVHLAVAFAAGDTLAAAFMNKELGHLFQVVNDADGLVHHHNRAGADAQALLFQRGYENL